MSDVVPIESQSQAAYYVDNNTPHASPRMRTRGVIYASNPPYP